MTIKILVFKYKLSTESEKYGLIELPIEYTQERKNYPPQCRLKSSVIYGIDSLEECHLIANEAQRYIRFTDAIGLPHDRLGKTLSIVRGTKPDDWKHTAYFTAGKKDRVVLDSPYSMNGIASGEWRSVWLPRQNDPYLAGKTYARLSAHESSMLDIEELADRVRCLNFPMVNSDLKSELKSDGRP